MFNKMTHFSDWAHLFIGLLVGILGPLFALPVMYVVVNREYIQEQEKREINRAGFDLEVWLTGLVPGLLVHAAGILTVVAIVFSA